VASDSCLTILYSPVHGWYSLCDAPLPVNGECSQTKLVVSHVFFGHKILFGVDELFAIVLLLKQMLSLVFTLMYWHIQMETELHGVLLFHT